MPKHPLDGPELVRLVRDIGDAATLPEWNRAVADLVHALIVQAQGGATPPDRPALVGGLVETVARGFVGKVGAPSSILRARDDALLIFEVLFPEGHAQINAGEAAKRLMQYENDKRRSRAEALGLPPPRQSDLVQIGEARGRVRRAMELYGAALPPGMPGFRSKRGP
jgi:hypothetical protein